MTDEATLTDTATSTVEPPAAEAATEAGTQTEGATTEAATVLGGEDVAASEVVSGAPEKYEFALEGVELDTDLLSEAEPILRELNLTNEQANALLPIAPKIMEKAQAATMQALVDAGAKQKKDWLDAFVADPEIGGNNRAESEHLAAKGMDALGFKQGHAFRQALTESGFGNHPDMIRVFRALGSMVGEDGSFVRTNDGVKEELPIEKRLYPND